MGEKKYRYFPTDSERISFNRQLGRKAESYWQWRILAGVVEIRQLAGTLSTQD